MTHTLSQSRGYSWEKHIVKEFNKDGWQCRRLGGSSSGLPDEIITNNDMSLLIAVEAKSSVYDYSYVDSDQVKRCVDILKMFGVYETRMVVLAFKFSKSKKDKTKKLKFYLFPILLENIFHLHPLKCFRCDRKGNFVIMYSSGETYNYTTVRWESIYEMKAALSNSI